MILWTQIVSDSYVDCQDTEHILYSFICKFNMGGFEMPLKVTFLNKSLCTMLADYPQTVVHSFLVSSNILLPLGFVRAQLAEK